MLFNSYAFVFFFFPLCILGFYACKAVCRKSGRDFLPKMFLIMASLWFYSSLAIWNLPFLFISMAVNYGICCKMRKQRNKKIFFYAGLFLNLAALCFFRYAGTSFVPAGISFFTFSQLAFLTECYRGNLGAVSVADYGVYVSFFPKLLQGPVALPHEILDQLQEMHKKKFSYEEFYRGICLFVLGLFKKALLADTLSGAVNYGYANLAALNSGDALIVMLSYTLQIYFDFSGYCDMAMGIGGMLGFGLPLNFDAPYKAGNILEFWKGWHITLTRFFTRYIYIPLGGSRRGRARTYFNILIVFFISGIWHGTGWQFLVWGMMHGGLYVLTRRIMDKRGAGRKENSIIKVFSVAGTFLYVNIAWVFFRASSVEEAFLLLKTIAKCQFARINWNLAGYFNLDEFWYVIKVFRIDRWQYAHYILMALLLSLLLLFVFFGRTAVNIAAKMKPTVRNTLAIAVLFVWCAVSFSQVNTFIYLNF